MPELIFKGKEFVDNHHLAVPHRPLVPDPAKGIGVTNSLVRRVSQHRAGEAEGFTERYNVNRLVCYEQYNDPRDAIAREKQLKRWRREKKEALINAMNPKWEDLGQSVLGLGPAPADNSTWPNAS